MKKLLVLSLVAAGLISSSLLVATQVLVTNNTNEEVNLIGQRDSYYQNSQGSYDVKNVSDSMIAPGSTADLRFPATATMTLIDGVQYGNGIRFIDAKSGKSVGRVDINGNQDVSLVKIDDAFFLEPRISLAVEPIEEPIDPVVKEDLEKELSDVPAAQEEVANTDNKASEAKYAEKLLNWSKQKRSWREKRAIYRALLRLQRINYRLRSQIKSLLNARNK